MSNVIPLRTNDEQLRVSNEAIEIIGLAIRMRMKIHQHPINSPLPADLMDNAYDALNELIKAAEKIEEIAQ